MMMFVLESIPQPFSSPSPRPQFFYALMSNNAKHPVICLLMVCITVCQESNKHRSDMPLKSLLIHRYNSIGQNDYIRRPGVDKFNTSYFLIQYTPKNFVDHVSKILPNLQST